MKNKSFEFRALAVFSFKCKIISAYFSQATWVPIFLHFYFLSFFVRMLCFSVYLFICLYVHLSIGLCVWMSVCMSVYFSIFFPTMSKVLHIVSEQHSIRHCLYFTFLFPPYLLLHRQENVALIKRFFPKSNIIIFGKRWHILQ